MIWVWIPTVATCLKFLSRIHQLILFLSFLSFLIVSEGIECHWTSNGVTIPLFISCECSAGVMLKYVWLGFDLFLPCSVKVDRSLVKSCQLVWNYIRNSFTSIVILCYTSFCFRIMLDELDLYLSYSSYIYVDFQVYFYQRIVCSNRHGWNKQGMYMFFYIIVIFSLYGEKNEVCIWAKILFDKLRPKSAAFSNFNFWIIDSW